MITLHDVKSGNSYEVKEGVTLQQVCEQYCQHDDMPIAAALYNNEYLMRRLSLRSLYLLFLRNDEMLQLCILLCVPS